MTVSGARDLKEMSPAVLRGSRTWLTITPGAALDPLPEAIHCTGAGDATLVDQYGHEETFPFLAGMPYPLAPYKVKVGSTATFIALY